MIKNERQYKITRAKADEMRVAISELQHSPRPDGLSPDMRELQLEALAGTLGEFPTALIRARIARGLTQRELAERLGLAEQAIQRYEATDYPGVSFSRLVEIAEALDLAVHYDVRLVDAS